MIDLTDASEKLGWAKRHLESLRQQVEPFEQRDTHRISVRLDTDAGGYVFSIHDLEPISPEWGWGLMIGDCIHNARTALDYVAVRLWAFVSGEDPSDVGGIDFPVIFVDPNISDAGAAHKAARGKFTGAFPKSMTEHPIFNSYLTRIEELQPFNHSNPAIWGLQWYGAPWFAAIPIWLDWLSRLDNADKHRIPHPVWQTIRNQGVEVLIPEGLTPDIPSWAAVENDTEISTWRFAPSTPLDWQPSEVEMKSYFPLKVAFGEQRPTYDVLEVLSRCLWAVESVIRIFEPVFRSPTEPPLPVTAIKDPWRDPRHQRARPLAN